jgi:hypothetical protein
MPIPSEVAVQAIAVLSPHSQPLRSSEPSVLYLEQPGRYSYTLLPSNTSPPEVALKTEYVTLKEAISSVPIALQPEFFQNYSELGDALAELKDFDQEDEWKIDAPVYDAARSIAFILMVNSFPAPRILHHGPKSVVFNWANESNNLYLTISSDRMSALISSRERIKRRIEFSVLELQRPVTAIRYIQADFLERPISTTVSTSSNLTAFSR